MFIQGQVILTLGALLNSFVPHLSLSKKFHTGTQNYEWLVPYSHRMLQPADASAVTISGLYLHPFGPWAQRWL